MLEDEAFVEEEDYEGLMDPPLEIIDPEVSSSPVKLSGGGPDSTKPSSPGNVPGRLNKVGSIN